MPNSYVDMSNLSQGDLVSEANLDNIRTNIEKFGGQLVGPNAVARNTKNDAVSEQLAPPDYDSGLFAVSGGTDYTKAHSLGENQCLVLVLHYAVASPGAADEGVIVASSLTDGTNGGIGMDGTNIYVETGSFYAVNTSRRQSTTGYYRIFAWELPAP